MGLGDYNYTKGLVKKYYWASVTLASNCVCWFMSWYVLEVQMHAGNDVANQLRAQLCVCCVCAVW